MSERIVDVAVVGGGLVGTSVAAALASPATAVTLIDAAPPSIATGNDAADWDSRIYAISPASMTFLASIGAWQRVDPSRVSGCVRMRVRGDAAGSELLFSAYEAGVPELAVMAESRELLRAITIAASERPGLTIAAPARCIGFERAGDHVRLRLDDGCVVAARLVVGADGARSWVREAAGIPARTVPYDQVAVVANFEIERPHRGTAYQWFRSGAVLAYLPLPGERMSMVWSCPESLAEELLALDAESLARRVAAAGEHALGDLRLITSPRPFPLARMIASRLVGERVALVGDAAHVVHPLAGQGVNLGFGDAQWLAETLGSRDAFRECGNPRLLRRYERGRAEDILAIRSVTHGLKALFGLPGPVPRFARNAGLELAGRLPLLKTILARHALG